MMDGAITAWRRQLRADLLARRQAVPVDLRRHAAEAIGDRLTHLRATLGSSGPDFHWGFYWPIRHEINLLPWARALAQSGEATLCLPVVVQPGAPLEYWRWTPDMEMRPGFWNIPAPVERSVVTPNVILAPVVGFDAARYRLGYGGGYFDRTLAAAQPRPIAIGVGYDFAVLDTIHPQPHDIPMDAVLTEHRAMLPPTWRAHAD
jgi:5-formyltetrahydrofolate cyclo-ligase